MEILEEKLEEVQKVNPNVVWGKHIGIETTDDSIHEIYETAWNKPIVPIEVLRLPEGLAREHEYILIDQNEEGRSTLLRNAALKLGWELPVRVIEYDQNQGIYRNLIESYKRSSNISKTWQRRKQDSTLVYFD